MKLFFYPDKVNCYLKSEQYFLNKDNLSVLHGVLSNTIYPSHSHDFDELVVVTNGSAIHMINGESYSIKAGDVFVLKANDLHSFEVVNQLEFYNIGYSQGKLDLLKEDIKKLSGYHTLFMLEPKYRKSDVFESKLHLNTLELAKVIELLIDLKHEYDSELVGSNSMVAALFMQLVVKLCRIYSQTPHQSRKSIFMLANAMVYIENNLTEYISLDTLSRISNISVSHFCRIFKETLTMSPIEYIIMLRIKKSMGLLHDRCLSITEIAFKCGFESSNYFSRVFKKSTGKTPKEYRQLIS